ncbi:type VII secretion target [Nocardioides sp. NPDC126508]
MSEIRVSPETLRLHAGHVDMSAGDVDQMAAAMETVSDEAFGVLCSFLPPIINTLWPSNLGAIRDAAGSLRASATSLREAAKDLESTDHDVARNARTLEGGLR